MQNVLADRTPLRVRRPARLLRLTSDERLVALVRGGDEGAFEALYDRHHPAILGFCRHMLGTREEAEDAVQHTFLAAYRDLVRHEQPIDLRPWLFTIARNRCLSLLRARHAHVAMEWAEPATDGLVATVERREDLRELLADLACLPEDQRAALLLAELGALDHAGVAAVLDCPREKVKALVFQARTSLAASREARATPCEEIRVELATASGGELRRGPLRRHLRTCAGCRAFKVEVATQRKLLALALPVIPSIALKASVLAGGSSGASAAGGGTAAAATPTVTGAPAGGALSGALGTVASTGAGKIAVSLAVAGAVAGGGALTAQLEQRGSSHVASAPSRIGTPHTAPVPSVAPSAPVHHDASSLRLASGSVSPPPAQVHQPSAVHPAGASLAAPSSLVPSHASTPVIGGRRSGAAPVTETPPAPAMGGARRHGSAAPHASGTALPPHAHGKQHSGVPPGQSKTPPGQSKTPAGQSGSHPGQSTTPPGQSGSHPGQSTTPPGQSKTPPGQSGSHPGGGPPAVVPSDEQSSPGPAAGNSGNGGPPADAGAPSHGQSGTSHGHAG